MTREEEIRARLEKATPGPWKVRKDDIGDEEVCTVSTGIQDITGYSVVDSDGGLFPWNEERKYSESDANADFIANAPSDIDYLLNALYAEQVARKRWHEETGRLQQENKRLRTMTIEKLLIDSQGVNMSVSGASGKEFMAMLIKVFEDSGGKNYLTMTFEKGEHKFEVTVRNLNGESSPAEKISELENENKRLRESIKWFEKQLGSQASLYGDMTANEILNAWDERQALEGETK